MPGSVIFIFQKELNPSLQADVHLDIASGEELYQHDIEGEHPVWLEDLHLTPSFTSGKSRQSQRGGSGKRKIGSGFFPTCGIYRRNQ